MTSETLIGRYEILGTLGAGGFAVVYRAWDPALGRQVALKVLLRRLVANTDIHRRFLAESQALAALQHPNIATVYDVGEAEGRPFFAMELIEGVALDAVIAERGPLSLQETTAILRPLASAVDYLHQAGLVHRDLKAANIMLDQSGRVVLMDFGIARSLDQTRQTQTGASLGTVEAMAPEQVRGEPAGPAADIYALGVLAFELLTGHVPFAGDTAYVLHAHVYEPPPLWSLPADLPRNVAAAIGAALAKEPEKRPASAGQFVAALTDSSIKIERTKPRNPAAWVAIGAGAGAALLVVVLLIVLATRGRPSPPATAAGAGSQISSVAEQSSTSSTIPATATLGRIQPPATAAPFVATATPPPRTPAPPPPVPAQSIGVSVDDPNCCRVSIERAERLGDSLRLSMSFSIYGDTWLSDKNPKLMPRIYLVDEQGRRSSLQDVSGPAASDSPSSEASGVYSFAAPAPDARWVWLHYPAGESTEIIAGFDLGAAAPGASPTTAGLQKIGGGGDVPGCCHLSVVQAQNAGGGSVRLLLSFLMNNVGWTSDNSVVNSSKIYLDDGQGRRANLEQVIGPAAIDNSQAEVMSGWYRFAPLPAGTRQVRLHYEGGVFAFDLGGAAPSR